jgi:hypothetical protein
MFVSPRKLKIMRNYNTFYLHFQVKGKGTEWQDLNLPAPNFFYRFSGLEKSYGVAWLVDGYFATDRNQKFLNDIIARFLLSLPVKERLKYPPKNDFKLHSQIFKLKQFQNLKSLQKEIREINLNATGIPDQTFLELKYYVEFSIRNNGGEGNPIEFDLLLDHAENNYEFKDYSTLKSKCRNIWNWYDKKNWQYHLLKKSEKTKEEIMATRIENAKKQNQKKIEVTRRKILSILTGIYSYEYKKKNGDWNIAKISKEAGVSRPSTYKYIKEFENVV